MDYMITYSREAFEAGELTSTVLAKLIAAHEVNVVPAVQKNLSYYLGQQEIIEKTRAVDGAPNITTVCNHAKDISDTASGYFLGTPISYGLINRGRDDKSREAAFDSLLEALDFASTDDDDQANALMLSIAGKTYEYIYASEDEARLKEEPLSPENTFMVYDETIEHGELFGVYYYYKRDDAADSPDTYLYALVMTDTDLKYYKMIGNSLVSPYKVVPHNLGHVPLVEYKNNRFCIGDFEQQISLIDAYNAMMSDRVDDKEQFIDAILVLYGAILGDDEEDSDDAQERLAKKKLLELPLDAKAEYLTRQLDEAGMEILRTALKEDIYTFSHVPNLTDENFAGNSSGVAMEYKLLGLEMLTKIKERYYRQGLRKRIKLFLHYLGLKGQVLEANDVEFVFSRGLPKNLLELSQIIGNLSDEVSQKTLLGLLPFVEDPDAEIAELNEQKEENVRRSQELFREAGSSNTTVEEELNEE